MKFICRALLGPALFLAALISFGAFDTQIDSLGLDQGVFRTASFFGLTLVAFLAFPTHRRTDLSIAALSWAAMLEVANILVRREQPSLDWLHEALGVLFAFLPGWIEQLRHQTRKAANAPSAMESDLNRRRDRSRIGRARHETLSRSGRQGTKA